MTRKITPLALLIAAAVLAYANTFAVPFVFDDIAAVRSNPTLEHFFTALGPPPGMSVSGRPLANLSLALNYAISGTQPWSYHVGNLLLHVLCTLALFGIIRRTLQFGVRSLEFGVTQSAPAPKKDSTQLQSPNPKLQTQVAFCTALLWSLHPLHTGTVTYVMQRTELLASACYLLTLFCFTRAAQPSPAVSRPPSAVWYPLSIAFCAAGMAAKEIMVTAPLIVLLYDRTFVAGSFATALRERKAYYAFLASTWLILATFVLGTDNRGSSAGFETNVAPLDYALTQLHAITHYLRLAFWPVPLVFDYGTTLVRDPLALVFGGVVVGTLLAVTLVALRRWPEVGFCGAWFFALLAPSSSFVPVATQVMGEQRVYLALAAVVVLVVGYTFRHLGRAAWALVLPIAFGLGWTTHERNLAYQSERTIWADTVTKRPDNARAHYNFGLALLADNDLGAAEHEFLETLRLEPTHTLARQKLGAALLAAGRPAEALPHLRAAVERRRSSATAHHDLGMALIAVGQLPEAVEQLAEAVRLAPNDARQRYNYARALADAGKYREALTQFEAAAELDPKDESARRNAARIRDYLGK